MYAAATAPSFIPGRARQPRSARVHRRRLGHPRLGSPVSTVALQSATTGGAAVGGVVASNAVAGAALSTGLATAGITAGIGAGVAVILALFAAHKARVAGAKSENAAVGILVPQAQQELQKIASLYNSGQLSQQDALTYIQQVATAFQQGIAPYQTGPGQHTTACASSTVPPGTPCNKNCTAGCCVYCNNIIQWVAAATAAVQSATGGTAQMNQVYGSPQYGYSGQGAWSLQFAPPGGSTSSLASAVSGSVEGVPLWVILAGLAGVAIAWYVL